MKSNFCFAPRSGKTLERHLRGSCGNLPARFSLFITRPAAVPNEPGASPSLAYFHGCRATPDTHYQPAIKLAAVACPPSSSFFPLLPDAPLQLFYSISIFYGSRVFHLLLSPVFSLPLSAVARGELSKGG